MNSMSFLRRFGPSVTREEQPRRNFRSKLESERFGFDRLEDRCLMAADTAASSVVQAVGTAAENFIANLYHDVLQRVPSAAEVSSWIQNIGNQTLDTTLRTNIATSFLNSAEAPTASDVSFFTNELTTLTRAQVVQQIVLSNENVQNIVTTTVQDFVGRTPTASELAAAQGIIQGIVHGNNPQAEVAAAASLLSSDAFFNKIV
jgi:hypothetical protein